MPGDTFVASVEAGLNTMVAWARVEGEYPADIMPKLVDRKSLKPGTGTSHREFLAAKLTASNYGEADEIDDPQELSGSILSATPQLVAIQTFIGKRVGERLSPEAYATLGQLAQNAIQRKKDLDGHALFATATTTMAGTGTTLTSGHILAGIRQITSDANEPGKPPIYVVLHGYQLYDIQSEIVAGIGTYPMPTGYSEESWKQGYSGGRLGGADVYEDGLIAVNATPDARGGIFAKMGICLVQGFSPWTEQRSEPQKGYGGMNTWLKDEYIYFERSPGNWMKGVLSDATAPTS